MTWSYDSVWEQLNLDLDAHAGLLQVLGKFYGDIYLSQTGRLRGMEYLDFVLSEVHGLRIKELQDAKAQGKKIIGTFCVFVPEEIVLAAGGVQVGLCAGAEAGKESAERILPRNTCALIKSFVGFKLSRLCPYIESCDRVGGETTCDGKKKAYEIFADYTPVYVMEIPQMKNACDRELWRTEVLRFKDRVEEITGNAVTAPKLRKAIKLVNDRCAAGTGKFLEFMATALQVPLESFGEFALRSDKRIQINSMCTVFAESEATSLMARGEGAENIAMGLHLAIVQRTVAMLRRVGVEHPVVFAGGVSHNPCVRRLLEEQPGRTVTVPENPDMVGALGAALHGLNSR